MADFACDVAREAGKMLMSKLPLGRWGGEGIEHKSARELVSGMDRAAETLIVSRLRQRYPDHAIYAEESGDAHAGSSDARYRWIIDPLDGTTNYLHGHPMFAVSIAAEELADKERSNGSEAEPGVVAACVYVPYLTEVFSAARGHGAFMNTETLQLSVSDTAELSEAIVATGFAYDRERYPNYDNFLALAKLSQGIRRCGAAAIDLAYVAAGRYDAFWELGLRSHDVAAGALLVLEAGGRVGDVNGGTGWLEGGNIIATNAELFEPLREQLDTVA